MKNFQKAIALADTVLQRFPMDSSMIFETYFLMDSVQNAIEYYKKEFKSDTNYYPDELAYLYRKLGMVKQADDVLNYLEKKLSSQIEKGSEYPGVWLSFGWCKYFLNKKDEAYIWFVKAVNGGFNDYRFVENNVAWRELLKDKRFQQSIEIMKARVDAQRKLVEEMEKAENQ
jgi:tetratricopeptide (TPR) repeat protein